MSSSAKIIYKLTVTAFSLLLFLYPLNLKAQKDCVSTLQEARKLYDLGIIDDIPKMLSPCMGEGFTRLQRIEAYKLLILVYLFDDEQFEAEKTMLEFLKKYPEYEIMPNDPVEFVYLFESFRTTSVFSIGFSAGFNLSNPRIIEPYSMYDLSKTKLSNTTEPGFQVALGIGRYLSKRILLNLEFCYAQNKYSFVDDNTIITENGNKLAESASLEEQINKFTVPVTTAFEFKLKKVLYYIRAGGSADYIIRASGTPTLKSDEISLPGEKTDLLKYRNSFYFNGIIGSGIRYKIPRGYLSIDLRYNIGLNNIVKTGMRSDNSYLMSLFKYKDDDFSINSFTFSVGYYFSFYSPKKQK
jgi:hypothetical protein